MNEKIIPFMKLYEARKIIYKADTRIRIFDSFGTKDAIAFIGKYYL